MLGWTGCKGAVVAWLSIAGVFALSILPVLVDGKKIEQWKPIHVFGGYERLATATSVLPKGEWASQVVDYC